MSISRRDIRTLARNQEQLRLEDLGYSCRALIHSPMYRSVHYTGCRRVGTSANDICIKCCRSLTFSMSWSNLISEGLPMAIVSPVECCRRKRPCELSELSPVTVS